MRCWMWSCVAIAIWLSGCAYDSRLIEKRPDQEQESSLEQRDLNGNLRRALAGRQETARSYAGLYGVMATCVKSAKYPWKISREVEEDVVRAREILELRHGEIPEFTRIVETHLNTLRENRELTDEVRLNWSRRLAELAEGCKRACR